MVQISGTIIATIAAMILGAVWYSPTIFGKLWEKLSTVKMGKQVLKSYFLMTLSFFIMFLVTNILMEMTGKINLIGAIQIGALVWLGYIATTTLGMITWENKNYDLYILNNSFDLLILLVGSILISLFY